MINFEKTSASADEISKLQYALNDILKEALQKLQKQLSRKDAKSVVVITTAFMAEQSAIDDFLKKHPPRRYL